MQFSEAIGDYTDTFWVHSLSVLLQNEVWLVFTACPMLLPCLTSVRDVLLFTAVSNSLGIKWWANQVVIKENYPFHVLIRGLTNTSPMYVCADLLFRPNLWKSHNASSVLTTESDICFIAYLRLTICSIYASRTSSVVFIQSISCKTQTRSALHKDPRCAVRPEFLRDAATQLINQRDGWLIRRVGAKVHMCDPGQGDCTRLHLKSLSHARR